MPGPIKAKVHATCSKQMATAFFYVKGLIYNNYMSRGNRVNANYIVGALGKFLTIFRQNRRAMAVPCARIVYPLRRFASSFCRRCPRLDHRRMLPILLEQPPYQLIPSDFLLFPNMKNKLPGCTLAQETF